MTPVEAIRTGPRTAQGAGLAGLLRTVPLPGGTMAQLPFRNLLRTPRRTAMTLLAITAVITIVISFAGMIDSFGATVDRGREVLLSSAPERVEVCSGRSHTADGAGGPRHSSHPTRGTHVGGDRNRRARRGQRAHPQCRAGPAPSPRRGLAPHADAGAAPRARRRDHAVREGGTRPRGPCRRGRRAGPPAAQRLRQLSSDGPVGRGRGTSRQPGPSDQLHGVRRGGTGVRSDRHRQQHRHRAARRG